MTENYEASEHGSKKHVAGMKHLEADVMICDVFVPPLPEHFKKTTATDFF